MRFQRLGKRKFLVAVAANLAAPAVSAQAVIRNLSDFSIHAWQDRFDMIGKRILWSATVLRVLQRWTLGGEMRIYPISVPVTDDLTRRGYAEVVEKRGNASWSPTPSMRQCDPERPLTIPSGDPINPLGARCICHGHITAFTAPQIRVRSAASRQTGVSAFTMNR